jgi:uncharacterized protein YqgV (UPF0045/DUF77 family)
MKEVTQELVDEVIEQMKIDIAAEDWTAIEELLKRVDYKILIGFMSEGESK